MRGEAGEQGGLFKNRSVQLATGYTFTLLVQCEGTPRAWP